YRRAKKRATRKIRRAMTGRHSRDPTQDRPAVRNEWQTQQRTEQGSNRSFHRRSALGPDHGSYTFATQRNKAKSPANPDRIECKIDSKDCKDGAEHRHCSDDDKQRAEAVLESTHGRCFRPGGTLDNSPAIYRWVCDSI